MNQKKTQNPKPIWLYISYLATGVVEFLVISTKLQQTGIHN